jgi:hypothetical protein
MENEQFEKLLKILKRIDTKLSSFRDKPSIETWVSVGIIQDLTRWNNKALEKARKNNLVRFKKNERRERSICLKALTKCLLSTKVFEPHR